MREGASAFPKPLLIQTDHHERCVRGVKKRGNVLGLRELREPFIKYEEEYKLNRQ